MITIETHKILVLRHAQIRRANCTPCGNEVEAVDLESACALTDGDRAAILRWLDRGSLHLADSDDGLQICLNSIRDFARRKPS